MSEVKATWLEVFWICPHCKHQNNRQMIDRFPAHLVCTGCGKTVWVTWP